MNKSELYQSKTGYRYSIDSFILADFISLADGDKIIDFGTGNGVIPLLLTQKTVSKIIGLEIQSSLLKHAWRNTIENKIEKQVALIQGDIRYSRQFLRNSYFDLVVSNPPYRKLNSGRLNPNAEKAIARHEIIITLYDLIDNAGSILKCHGKLVMIYVPERYDELINVLRKNGLIPKKIRFVYSSSTQKTPKMFLIEAVKSGKGERITCDPLYIYDNYGNYSTEMKKIYDSFNNHSGTNCNREVGKSVQPSKASEN